MTKSFLIFLGSALISSASAQFSSALLQNESYWADGKAEFNIYAAEIVRDGVPRACEALHIFVRDSLDSVPVLRLNQILNVPTGLTALQEMRSNYWRLDNSQLIRFWLTSSDGVANNYRELRRNGEQLAYESRGVTSATQSVTLPANGYFYDELPWLVRTIDFSKPSASFEIMLAFASPGFEFKPAKFSSIATERTIDVRVIHAGGEDRFTLDREGPHLLREWKAADGSRLKMKRNLKVDYWNYTKPGDRERALNNPMLRLPD